MRFLRIGLCWREQDGSSAGAVQISSLDIVTTICHPLLMGWLVTIAVGFVAGALGRFVVPGKDPGKGCLITTLLGIAGAVVGKYVGGLLGYIDPDAGKAFDLPSIGLSVVGVVILLVIYRLIFGEKKK